MFTQRSELILGADSTRLLSRLCVAVVGVGGVGCAAVEALARAGVGTIAVLDHDYFESSNKNRQLYATDDVLGLLKVDVARSRIASINANAAVHTLPVFLDSDTIDDLFALRPDHIIDAIDTISAKLLLARRAQEVCIPLIAAMGTGGRTDPTQFRVGTLANTAGTGCPVARVMRREGRKRGLDLEALRVVYSLEAPLTVTMDGEHGRHPPGSVSFVPSVAGFVLAGAVIEELLREHN